jgi:hypothetical protein
MAQDESRRRCSKRCENLWRKSPEGIGSSGRRQQPLSQIHRTLTSHGFPIQQGVPKIAGSQTPGKKRAYLLNQPLRKIITPKISSPERVALSVDDEDVPGAANELLSEVPTNEKSRLIAAGNGTFGGDARGMGAAIAGDLKLKEKERDGPHGSRSSWLCGFAGKALSSSGREGRSKKQRKRWSSGTGQGRQPSEVDTQRISRETARSEGIVESGAQELGAAGPIACLVATSQFGKPALCSALLSLDQCNATES